MLWVSYLPMWARGYAARQVKNYQQQNIRLFNLVNDIPMMEVITSAPCYREFVRTRAEPCKTLLVRTSDVKKRDYARRNLIKRPLDQGVHKLLSPAFCINTATEYGVFDYS
ncbi:hypothetical protein O9929_00885 [Vibrio lentus]|nr:hypothetical protein [Vibrio lentus]